MRKFISAFILFAVCAFGADITGKWTGSFEMTSGDEKGAAYMDVKQTGETLTGTAGPNSDALLPIKAGKVDGNKVHFELEPAGDGPRLFVVELVLQGDTLSGEVTIHFDESRTAKGKLELKRES